MEEGGREGREDNGVSEQLDMPTKPTLNIPLGHVSRVPSTTILDLDDFQNLPTDNSLFIS